MLLSLVRQVRLFSHAADCRRRSHTSTFRGGRVQNGRVRPGHTWREPGGSTNSPISDSVRLKPGRDKSAIEVATLPLGYVTTYIYKTMLVVTSTADIRKSTVNYAPTKKHQFVPLYKQYNHKNVNSQSRDTAWVVGEL